MRQRESYQSLPGCDAAQSPLFVTIPPGECEDLQNRTFCVNGSLYHTFISSIFMYASRTYYILRIRKISYSFGQSRYGVTAMRALHVSPVAAAFQTVRTLYSAAAGMTSTRHTTRQTSQEYSVTDSGARCNGRG